MQKRYRIYTLGCKVNQQESETIASGFFARGFLPAEKGEEAGVCIINSCTVTSMADSKTRQKIRQARKKNPSAFVCVVGCLPEVAREQVLGMGEVDLAVGSADKERTVELVLEALAAREGAVQNAAHTVDTLRFAGARPKDVSQVSDSEYKRLANANLRVTNCCGQQDANSSVDLFIASGEARHGLRTRALLKVEDGCDRYCAFCIIPYARGAVRSRPAEEVLREAEGLLKAGYKELVLTGINLALYGQDLSDGVGLYKLVKRICGIDAGGEFRVRIGSLEPTVIDAKEAVRLAKIKGVCPHFHLSLQSGCGRTLQAMGRPYTPEDFEAIVIGLREIDPLFGITTDVIVGFPGETDEDFEESLSFVKRIGFAHVHVFKYSKRPGTRGAEMPDQVSEVVKNKRSKMMAEAAKAGAKGFLSENTDNQRRVLILGTENNKRGKTNLRGLTDNGIDVRFSSTIDECVQNEFCTILLKHEYLYSTSESDNS